MIKKKKILFTGYEIGGQMQLLAETLRKRGISATSVALNDDFRQFKNDINLGRESGTGCFQKILFLIWAIFHFDVFYFNWGKSLLSVWRYHLLELFFLRLFKKTIIVHFRGGDIYDAKMLYDQKNHMGKGSYSDSLFENYQSFMRRDQIENLRKWKKYAHYIFVSTPDLLLVSKHAQLFPQIIDNYYWQPKVYSDSKGIIKVLHAPTNQQKKGTDILQETIKQLQLKGVKVILVLVDKIPYSQTKEIFQQCDIGVDQLMHGWYGKISVELMSLGKPVICNISSKLINYRPDLPIVHGDPNNIFDVLEKLILNKELREDIGKKSKDYVNKHHNLEREVDRILDILH
jgi:glycosyltransferase involved in cell wall biosynthesis